jgi:hypothetical protein
MANKFKAAAERQKVRPGSGEPVVPTETVPAVEESPEPVTAPAPEPSANPLADMIEKKEVGKACGFYLSPGSIKKLDKAAKQLKCSKSKALDLLIQKYL